MVGQFAIKTYPVARAGQPFSRAGLFVGQAPKTIRPVVPMNRYMGQNAQEVQPVAPLTEAEQQTRVDQYNQILRSAAAKMLKSAGDMENNLNTIYNNYVNYGNTNWDNFMRSISAAAGIVLGPAPELYRSWKESGAAKKATTVIQAGNHLYRLWDSSFKKDYLWPLIDDINGMDPILAGQISNAYDRVVLSYTRNWDLAKKIGEYPTVLIGDFVGVFFPELLKRIKEAPKDAAAIIVSLDTIRKGLVAGTKGAAKVIESAAKILTSAGVGAESAPWLVIGGVAIIAVWLLLR